MRPLKICFYLWRLYNLKNINVAGHRIIHHCDQPMLQVDGSSGDWVVAAWFEFFKQQLLEISAQLFVSYSLSCKTIFSFTSPFEIYFFYIRKTLFGWEISKELHIKASKVMSRLLQLQHSYLAFTSRKKYIYQQLFL